MRGDGGSGIARYADIPLVFGRFTMHHRACAIRQNGTGRLDHTPRSRVCISEHKARANHGRSLLTEGSSKADNLAVLGNTAAACHVVLPHGTQHATFQLLKRTHRSENSNGGSLPPYGTNCPACLEICLGLNARWAPSPMATATRLSDRVPLPARIDWLLNS